MPHKSSGRRARTSLDGTANKGKKGRITAALYKSAHRLGARAQVSVLQAFHRPAGATGNAKGQETPQQAESRHAKQLKRQHEDKLWKTYSRNRTTESRNALWVHYLPLVRYIAERVKARLPECVEFADLVSAGSCGLQDAIAKFDPQLGIRFQTYCLTRIRGAILDYVRDMDWIPRIIRNKAHQFEKVKGELAARLRRDPTDEEIARKLGISSQDFQELQKELDVKSVIPVGIYNKNNFDGREVRMDMFEAPGTIDPTHKLQEEEVRRIALHALPKPERTVIENYYFRGRSMRQIGEQLGLSESRICQIHAGVLAILRKRLPAYRDSCFID
ncbi:MAG: FliA/WhiG family RNA polymerase sigma factor [Planctomycetota bacterium]